MSGRQLRFGILTFPGGSIDELTQTWLTAERLGFDSAWVADTVSLSNIQDYEAWTILAALATKVPRLRIGTLVTQITFRHPTILAAQAITVDHISGGRLELGIGAGDYAADSAAVGEQPWKFDERLNRFDEQLTILQPLLRGEPVDYHGRYYRAKTQLAKPVKHRIPLIVAGQVRRSLKLAARFCDGWNTLGGQPLSKSGEPPLSVPEAANRTAEQVKILEEYCRELGRDPASVRRSILPYRLQLDPLSSVDKFDDFVGHYSQVGIDEFIFYWPPLENARRREPPSKQQEQVLEQVASERFRSWKAEPESQV